MPLNVAQLNIGVTADTSQAQTALNNLNSGISTMGANAMTAISGGFNAAFQQVQVSMSVLPSEIEAINGRMAELWPAATAGAEQFAGAMNQVNASMSGSAGIGSTAASALGNVNMAMVASGQQLGPLNSGLMLLGTTLRQIPSDASASSTALYAVAGALTALGIASAAAAAPLHQATEGLASAMQNNGDAISEWTNELDQAKSHAENLGFTNTEMEKGLTVLTRGFGDTSLAMKELNDTEDLARVRHQSVEAAAQTVVRAYEGYGRSLKELGINMTFVRNTQQALDAANKTLTDSTQRLSDATAKYNEALDRNKATHEEAALARDQLAAASQRLGDAQANLIYTEARIAADNAAQATQVTERARATDTLATATSNLNYIQQKQADEAAVAAAKLHDSTTLTQVDYDNMAQSADRVMEAQQRMAAATGGGILAAQQALRNSISQQREELDRLHAKLMGKDETPTSKAEADLKALESAHELANAEDAVNKARAAVPLAIQKDYADQQLKALEQANQLRTAQNQVRDAHEAVSQALKNQQAEAIKLRIADLAVADAKRNLDDATRKEQEAQQKVVDATAKHNQELQQQEKVLQAIHDKIKGFADSQATGWVGSLNRIKAAITDWLAHFGNGAGKFLTFALPVMLMLRGLGGALFGGAAAEGAAGAAGAAVEGGGLLGGLGALAAAAAPVVAVVAAVAAVAAAFYLAYTHVKSFHDSVDKVGNFLSGTFRGMLSILHGPLSTLSDLFHTISKDVSSLAHDVFQFFGDKVKEVTKFLHEHETEIHSLGSTFSGLLNVLKNVAEFIAHLIKPALDGLVTSFRTAWTIIYTVVRVAWDIIKGTITIALDLIKGIIGTVLDVLAGHWGKAWHEISHLPGQLLSDMAGTIGSVLGDLATGIVKLGEDIAKGLWHGIEDTFKLLFDLPGLAWKHIIKPILEFFGIASPSTKMHGFGGDIIHGLWNGIVDGFGTFMNFEGKVYDWIVKPVENIGGQMVTIGTNLLIGLWNGIADWSGQFTSKISDFFGSVVDDIGSFLGIGSPSTITHQHGEWLMEGLANGIQAGLPRVLAAINANSGLINNSIGALGAAGVNATSFGGLGLTGQQEARARAGVGSGGTPVIVQNFNRELLRVDGNLVHERDLPDYIKQLVIPAAKRQGGNFFGGYG